MVMHAESHVFREPSTGLAMTAKRYTFGDSASNAQGLTLLFTHCVGSHKEQWEVVLETLFNGMLGQPDSTRRIREAWSFDRQNHGDAAVLNSEFLKSRPEGVSLYDWAGALVSFIRSPAMAGHRLVTIGHSAGSTAWTLTTNAFNSVSEIPFVAMIPVESTMVKLSTFKRDWDERMEYMDFVVNATKGRRDTWPSRDAAEAYFRKRYPWSMWDERALKLFVKYGLHELADGTVMLKCPREQEAVSYPDKEPHFESDTRLREISQSVAVHVVWGERVEFIPEYIRESLSDPTDGRRIASVSEVEDAGHMVVQEKPEGLAHTIAKILASIPPPAQTTVGPGTTSVNNTNVGVTVAPPPVAQTMKPRL